MEGILLGIKLTIGFILAKLAIAFGILVVAFIAIFTAVVISDFNRRKRLRRMNKKRVA